MFQLVWIIFKKVDNSDDGKFKPEKKLEKINWWS